MKIVLITDSFGGKRVHANIIEVDVAQTYPELVKVELARQGHEVEIDYASFRQVKNLPGVIEKNSNADIYVIQVGIVDFYPRPLTQKYTLSQTIFAKLLRRIIRLKRSFVIKYIYNTPWSSETDVRNAIEIIYNKYKTKFIWINAAPINEYQERETPGAMQSIKMFNQVLSEIIKTHPDSKELNIFDFLIKEKNNKLFLHPLDSHLNIEGNKLYADEILKMFNLFISAK